MALTTLAKCKSQLGFQPSDIKWDAKIQLYLDAASDAIESYCQRSFSQANYTEYFSGNRGDTLIPSQYPVTSLSELRVDFDRLWSDPNTLIPATDYGISNGGLSVTRYSGLFPKGRDVIRMMYTAGYSTIPNDLQLATVWATEWYYLHNNRGDMGRTSSSKGDESVGVVASMPPMIKEMIQRYKRMEFPTINLPVNNP